MNNYMFAGINFELDWGYKLRKVGKYIYVDYRNQKDCMRLAYVYNDYKIRWVLQRRFLWWWCDQYSPNSLLSASQIKVYESIKNFLWEEGIAKFY